MKIIQPFLLLLYTFSLTLLPVSELPSKLKKKVDKEIKLAFNIEDFTLKPIIIEADLNKKLHKKIKENSFYKIFASSEFIGYVYVDKAPSKTDEFDYLVLFDEDLIIKKTKVLIYREDYGGEIGSKRWLKQFIGKKSSDKLIYEKDIIAISGATISANAMTIAINNLLQSINILQKHHRI